STTMRATLALATPITESGPVRSAMTPTLMDGPLMAISSARGRPLGHGSCGEIAQTVRPAHGVDSLCRGHSSLDQAALQCVKRRGRPGGHADLGIEALDVIIGRFRRDIEPAGRLLGGQSPRGPARHFD